MKYLYHLTGFSVSNFNEVSTKPKQIIAILIYGYLHSRNHMVYVFMYEKIKIPK